MKAFIQKRIRQVESWLKELPIGEPGGDCFRDECLSIGREIKAEAIRTGHPAIVELCQRRNGGLRYTQRLLADCLATFAPETLTPPEVARRLKKSPDYVRDCIRRGQLKASNLGKGRPRWVVTTAELDRFMQGKQSLAPTTPKRRVKTGSYKRYST
ncbi:helix-turn-helix domain-containing protein [Lacipirellula sp.]|uniref:helix-turn-helix domain-containing protein n=1 Tax=Lacipirellula sp. TaxID=2691419 RepID=UPI003D0B5509